MVWSGAGLLADDDTYDYQPVQRLPDVHAGESHPRAVLGIALAVRVRDLWCNRRREPQQFATGDRADEGLAWIGCVGSCISYVCAGTCRPQLQKKKMQAPGA